MSNFFTATVISGMACYRSGWAVGDGVGGGGGWVAGSGLNLHKDTDSSAVSSVSDRKGLNPQDRSRQSLTAIWYQSHPY